VRRAAVLACALVASAAPATVHAYSYELSARTIGQLYQLPTMRLLGGDLWLSRRRFTQTLNLSIWDVGDLAATRARRRPGAVDDGPTIWFTGYLRLDHDFGAWTMGTVDVDGQTLDAIDEIPELAGQSLGFAIPYGYLAVDGLGGRVDLRFGRQLRMDELESGAVDGLTARLHTGTPVLVEVQGGLRVRDTSPLALAGSDLDGAAGADCREYVEAATAGAGTWQLIDRSRAGAGSRYGSDLADCPQREALMPTASVALETDGLRHLDARVSYRRSQSRTVGVIDGVDRLDHPDTGLYPNERGQAPSWGVNEETLAASARGAVAIGRTRLAPWAHARYSLVHGVVDEAGAGLRVERGAHILEPEVARARPVFDADSIWSVFAVGASADARLSYRYAPKHRSYRGHAASWLRRYDADDVTLAQYAGGGTVAAEVDLAARWRGQGELFVDDGYGGRRLGGLAMARWQRTRDLVFTGRAGLITVDADFATRVTGTSASLAVATQWQVDDGIALHASGELTDSPLAGLAFRTLFVVDLAFEPEI